MNSAVVTREMLVDLNKSLGGSDIRPVEKKLTLVSGSDVSIRTEQTEEEFGKLVSALKVISPDIPRGNGSIDLDDVEPTDYWLGVIWAIAALGWDYGEILAKTWSKRSTRYTDEGFEKAWADYDPIHPSPIGIGSVYKLADKLKGKNTEPVQVVVAKPQTGSSPLSILSGYSLTGNSEQMRLQMLDDVYVLKELAILGQWSTLYGSPNSGKTLITLWLLQEQINAGVIEGDKVFYINADDTFKGAVDKIELAEQWDMQMLVPGHNGFKASHVPIIMQKLAETGEARGIVLVLDTLKKFTDLMDKSAASAFGVTAREFVSAGGTLICMAHTNKHTDADGKGIYSGTSDIVDDSDCMYIIDKLSNEGDEVSRIHTVEFTNNKARGDVATSAIFTYVRSAGQEYDDLLNTVKRIKSADADAVKEKAERNKQLEQDEDVIQAITNNIRQGVVAKSELIKSAMSDTAASKAQVKGVLERWTGSDYAEGHRWTFKAGEHNKYSYSLATPPSLS